MVNFVKSKLKAARDFIKTGDFSAAYAASQEVLSYDSNNCCTKRRGLAVRRKCAVSLDDLHKLLRAYSSSCSRDDMLSLALIFTAFFALLQLGEVVTPDSFPLRKSHKMIGRHLLS
ncbi:hypothetical protein BS47DRAFT_1482825 [Hydnum rufescens UP504]|uniref:Uncharacterized protein n=1 Tax=Hydnum rufescens UP504 TaxID=1448309 RepID=A0A9P6B5L7_9AGAM|nr:hypothetical protein BS47DRAFT_1482825 [Hydnum rufescens UP504]